MPSRGSITKLADFIRHRTTVPLSFGETTVFANHKRTICKIADVQALAFYSRSNAGEPQADILTILEQRLGRRHARDRLRIENEHESQVFGQGINFFHFENLPLSHVLICAVLMATGLYQRGLTNAAKVGMRHNRIESPLLPKAFDGFTLLQLSDLHVEMSETAMGRVIDLLEAARYDACVLTGDYRGETCGPYDTTLVGMARVRVALKRPIYGVLGNHDTIFMVPGLEAMGIRMLLNESEVIERGGQHLYLAGIDDAHFYRMDNIEKAAFANPTTSFRF